jgi:ABC-type Fe3+-hydroxamate transport system substrate-binding protein
MNTFRIRRVRYAIILLTLILVLVSVTGGMGAAPKQRIVCLAPSCVEVIYALGVQDYLVGWSQYADYPPEITQSEGWVPYDEYQFISVEDELAKDVAVVSGFVNYNREVIDALNPTLIIATESLQKNMADELAAAGYNVLYHNPTTLDEVFQSIIDIGAAAGRAKKAIRLVDGYYEEIAEIEAITDNLPISASISRSAIMGRGRPVLVLPWIRLSILPAGSISLPICLTQLFRLRTPILWRATRT